MSSKMSFEEVLDAIMLEEPTPSREALSRWSERYPEYRHALAEYFATWAIQKYRPEPAPEIDQETIVRKGVDHAMEIVRRQGRVVSGEAVIGPDDQLVLAAVYLLHGNGYAVNVSEKVGEMSGKRPSLGGILMSLDVLERKGLISSRSADQGRTYYAATLAGNRALATVRQTSNVLLQFLPDFA